MFIKDARKSGLFFLLVTLVTFCTLFTSCVGYKNTAYFKDIPDSLKNANNMAVPMAVFSEPKIQPGDLLYITVQTIDPKVANGITGSASMPSFITQTTSSASTTGTLSMPSYLVDDKGMIELPLVGSIKVSGYTTTEVKDLIRDKAKLYYNEPVVNVRFANFNITVLGEVNRPAQYTMPTEKVTLLDAIGVAGDLTIYGKRGNILLIREENGIKKPIRFSLNSTDMMASPYFYLRPNDVIYVEPNKAKVAANDAVRDRNIGYAITIATSLVSIIIILITRN